MKRSQAADLIDRIRQLAATQGQGADGLRSILLSAGLAPLTLCGGDAHRNPHVDNCAQCAPRWGVVGPREPVT